MSEHLYENYGISFRFPTDWELEETTSDERIEITISSPDTAFWSLTLDFDRPDPQALVESAIAAFTEEYENTDHFPTTDSLDRLDTVSHDVEFVCLELVNSAQLRSAVANEFTLFVLAQSSDIEREEHQAQLAEITKSLSIEDSADPFTEWYSPGE